jgi:hypothetical protein
MIRSVRRYVAVCLQFGRSRSEPPAGTKIVTSATRIRICTARDKSLLRLEINWLGHQFHLETLITAFCFKDPAIDAAHPTNIFNTYVGFGTGRLDGAAGATAAWTFTDAGEPGKNDTATIVIKDSHGTVVLTVSGNLDSGNQQAHLDNK